MAEAERYYLYIGQLIEIVPSSDRSKALIAVLLSEGERQKMREIDSKTDLAILLTADDARELAHKLLRAVPPKPVGSS